MDIQTINNPVLRASREHEIIFRYVVDFDRMMQHKAYQALFEQTRSRIKEFQRELLSHFRAEETRVFPSAIAVFARDSEAVTLILGLQRDHGRLEQRLADLVERSSPEAHLCPRFVAAMEAFLHELKAHARKEIELLFPRLSGSAEWLAQMSFGGAAGDGPTANGSPPPAN